MVVRAKFKVVSIKHVDWSPTARVIEMMAVSADEVEENQRFHQYTPSGRLEITVDNPPAAEQLKLGNSYYLDFTPVDGG